MPDERPKRLPLNKDGTCPDGYVPVVTGWCLADAATPEHRWGELHRPHLLMELPDDPREN